MMMKELTKNPIKALAMLAIAFGILFTTSCDSGDDEPEEVLPTESIAELLDGGADYSDFIAFYELNADLLPDISGETAYTVFVPNDAAFDKLRATLQTEDLTSVAPEVIASVLAFHFVPGTTLEADFGTSLTTVQGEQITWTTSNTIVQGGSDNSVEILESDIKATNGVVHVVETILIPPTIFIQIGLNLGSLAQPVLLGAAFSDLRQVIAKADSEVPSGQKSIKEILADQDGAGAEIPYAYTVFLPVNDVVAGVAAHQEVTKEQLIGSLTSSAAVARGWLLNHIYQGSALTGDDLKAAGATFQTNPQSITMMSGATMYIVYLGQATETSPTGLYLTPDLADQSKYLPVFATDAFIYQNQDGTATGANNGSLHINF